MKATGAYSHFWRMLRRCVLALFVALAGASAHAADDPKLALVVANWAYAPGNGEQWPLSRPGADAAAISEALTTAGFTVRPFVRNADKARLEAAIAAFAADVRAAGPRATAVFYYAGHGGADVAGGGNHIVPVDASPESVTRIDRTGVSVDFVTRTIAAAGARATLVIFDACRNPLLQPGETPAAPAPISGWVRERERVGAIVSFAQIQDEAAMDDGVFAMSLASAIKTRGLTIEQALDKVQSEVAVRSRGRQAPSYLDGIVETICLYDCTAPQAALQNTDQALSVLRSAQTQRPRGDQGQAAALQALMAQGRTFEGFDFAAISFARADLAKLRAAQSDFSLSDLSGANLSESDLTRAGFKTANLTGARLEGAAAPYGGFALVKGQGLSARSARLRASAWVGADVRRASFQGADLAGATFAFADLREADFTGANLTDVIFFGADLRGARLEGATLRNNDLTFAVTDEAARARMLAAGGCGRKLDAAQIAAQPLTNGQYQMFGGDIFAKVYPVFSARSGEGLGPCPKTTAYRSEDAPQGLYAHESDYVVATYTYRYDTTYLNRRNADVENAFRTLEEALTARKFAFEQLPHVQRGRAALQAEMEVRARQTRPLVPPTPPDIENTYDSELLLLSALAATPAAIPDSWSKWGYFASRRLDAERSRTDGQLAWGTRGAGAPWPKLYPDAAGKGDIELLGHSTYRAWTRARARHITPEIVFSVYSRALPADLSNVTWRSLASYVRAGDDGVERRAAGDNFSLVFLRPPGAAFLREWVPDGRIPSGSKLTIRVVRAELERDKVLLYVEPVSMALKSAGPIAPAPNRR